MAWTVDPYALVDLAEAKEHLEIPTGNTGEDQVVTRLINSSLTLIERYIDRKIVKRQFDEVQDGRGTNRLLLRHWPADKPTELWDDNEGLFTDTDKQIDTADFVLEGTDEGGIGVVLLGGLRFSKGTRNVKIVYEAGYDPVPHDLKEASLWTIDFLKDIRSDRRVGKSSKSKNAETENYYAALPDFIKEILDPYKRFEFPGASIPVRNV